MFENDYIMRLIHEIVRTLIKLIFKIDIDEADRKDYKGDFAQSRWDELLKLADAGKINEAENRLYDLLDVDEVEDLRRALLFYDHINDYDNEFLEKSNYSREEIHEGIGTVLVMYGYGSLKDTLM